MPDVYVEMDEHGESSTKVLRELAKLPNVRSTQELCPVDGPYTVAIFFELKDGSILRIQDHVFNNALIISRVE